MENVFKKSLLSIKNGALLWGFLCFGILSAFGQNNTITGTVVDGQGQPIPAVSVVIKGTSTGVAADFDGNYTINANSSDILVFSNIGFVSAEVTVGNQRRINVTLQEDVSQLDEVVVIGYGTQKFSEVTSAVVRVTPDEFVPGAVRNVGELIRGKVAGLSVTTSSGNPNADTEIQLRGITSIEGGSSPLVLIDGYPGALNTVSPNDIESIDILKDASAAAIYGTRGKNGVILITTKKAREGMPFTVEYSAYQSIDRFARKAEVLDANDVRRLIGEGLIDPSFDEGFNTDWFGEISNSAPLSHFHNLSMRGGIALSNYTVNLNYRDQQGAIKESEREEFILRADVNHEFVKDKLIAHVNVLHGIRKNGNRSFGGNEGFSDAGPNSIDGFEGLHRQAIIRNPTDRILDDDGNWQQRGINQYDNPLARLNEETYDDETEYTWLTGGFTYKPIEGMSIKLMGSKHTLNRFQGIYQTKQHVSNTKGGRNGLATIRNDEILENFLDFTIDYSKEIGDHRFTGLLGYSYIDTENSGNSITNYDFPTDEFSYNQIQLGRAIGENRTGSGISSYRNDWTLVGFFGRLVYGFSDRYNLLASLRREGSSKFGENNKWGWFPAISAGWTISNESFLKESSTISNLKLRVGYGITGSVPNVSYQSLTRYAYSGNQFAFQDGEWKSILQPIGNPNPDLKWERNLEYNIGLDFGLFKNRLTGTVDYYDRTVKDLLFNFPVPVPPNLVGTTLANAAVMENSGIEVNLNIMPVSTDNFEWSTNLNFSKNTNKLASISNDLFRSENPFFNAGSTGAPIQTFTHRHEVGKAMGNFWGFKVVDVDSDGAWIMETPDGTLKPLSENTADDKQVLGNGLPSVYAAWNNNFRYKKFDLNITMRGAFDYQILNFTRMYYENPNTAFNKLKSAYDPVFGKEILSSPLSLVSYYIEDGDHWKIDNITLGYNLDPGKFLKGLRVYGSVSNLAVITGYSGIDPEVGRNPLSPGNDSREEYPTTTTFTLGFDAKF